MFGAIRHIDSDRKKTAKLEPDRLRRPHRVRAANTANIQSDQVRKAICKVIVYRS